MKSGKFTTSMDRSRWNFRTMPGLLARWEQVLLPLIRNYLFLINEEWQKLCGLKAKPITPTPGHLQFIMSNLDPFGDNSKRAQILLGRFLSNIPFSVEDHIWSINYIWDTTTLNLVYNADEGYLTVNEKLTQRNLVKFLWSSLPPWVLP